MEWTSKMTKTCSLNWMCECFQPVWPSLVSDGLMTRLQCVNPLSVVFVDLAEPKLRQVNLPLWGGLHCPRKLTAGEDFPVLLPHQSRDLESETQKYMLTHNHMLQNSISFPQTHTAHAIDMCSECTVQHRGHQIAYLMLLRQTKINMMYSCTRA